MESKNNKVHMFRLSGYNSGQWKLTQISLMGELIIDRQNQKTTTDKLITTEATHLFDNPELQGMTTTKNSAKAIECVAFIHSFIHSFINSTGM